MTFKGASEYVFFDILDKLSNYQRESKAGSCNIPLNYFNRAYVMSKHTLEGQTGLIDEEAGIFADARISDLSTPLDVSILRDDVVDDDVHYGIMRVKHISNVKKLRGKVAKFYPIVVEVTACFIKKDGTYETFMRYLTLINGQWRIICTTHEREHLRTDFLKFKEDMHNAVKLAIGLAFSNRYDWFIEFGYKDGATLSFPCTPEHCKDVFKMRDVPDGKSRRAALKNWVASHKRKVGDSQVDVRKHLRGSYNFNYDGLFCKIHPSEYDRTENKEIVKSSVIYFNEDITLLAKPTKG